ncbi:hypothetical protein ON010_g15194 [Phytophthora cinnamomi]|nr:hypothetical protein ON010_g15194 [Phytophthora cinnamomi]
MRPWRSLTEPERWGAVQMEEVQTLAGFPPAILDSFRIQKSSTASELCGAAVGTARVPLRGLIRFTWRFGSASADLAALHSAMLDCALHGRAWRSAARRSRLGPRAWFQLSRLGPRPRNRATPANPRRWRPSFRQQYPLVQRRRMRLMMRAAS